MLIVSKYFQMTDYFSQNPVFFIAFLMLFAVLLLLI